ncbi:protein DETOXIFICATION 16-like [Phalaenopsis equestris]|uniref:protein DETOXIFICATION 16-like n=1 Tax=Phalaenopsis equestris TaxID=78828 RepID=UPI0009E212D6|nr:protein DETOXIFICATION 16-like [Phalaenopsis equestris]
MEKTEGMSKEIKRQMRLAMPLSVANLLMFALQFVSIMLVGHISHQKLAGASIAISFVNSIGFSVLMGVSSALDTLCGQSYGAENYKMVGLHLQRAMVICVLASIPLAFAMAFSGTLLILLRQVPEISMAAQSYAQLMIPSLFAFGLIQCILRFLQAQKIVVPIMLSAGMTAIFHCVNCWFFTFKTGLGYRGAALSVSISYWFNLLLLVIYVIFSPSCKSTWTGLSRGAFHGLWDFLKLAIPSTLMVCFQNWQFELLLLLAGLLTNPELQTSLMSISQNISSLVYVIPLGVSGAVSTRISNELGAKNPRAAVLAVLSAAISIIIEGLVVGFVMIGGRQLWGHAYTSERVVVNAVAAMISIIIEGLVVGFVMIGGRQLWGNAYTSERVVVNAVAAMVPWIALSHCIDGFQCVLLGTIRGSGKQMVGAFVCLGSYYLVGIPASILLGFVFHLGVKGLWIGNICAILVQDLVLLTMTVFTDWEKQVTKAMERVQPSEKPSSPLTSDPNYWIFNTHALVSSFSISFDSSE